MRNKNVKSERGTASGAAGIFGQLQLFVCFVKEASLITPSFYNDGVFFNFSFLLYCGKLLLVGIFFWNYL